MKRISFLKRISTLLILFNPIFISVSANAQTYCPISGLNTSYEYIQSVEVDDEENISGQNNGYADFSLLSGATLHFN